MGIAPAVIRAAFSVDCWTGFGACDDWAAANAHTVRNVPMIFILALSVLLPLG
jgi:hypothetical protein